MPEKEEALIILTPGFASSEEDSTCLPMQQQLVQKITELNPRLAVIVLAFQYPYHTNEYKWNQVRVIPFDGRNKGGVQRLLLRKKVNSVLNKLSSQYHIKGLFSFWLGECALVGKKFGEKYGIKHYCWLLGQDARKGNKYVARVHPSGNELLALSDFLKKEFHENYGIEPQRIVLPGIEPVVIDPLPRDIAILGAGSLIPLKQFDIFIEMLAEVKNQLPGFKSVIVGEGPERKKLMELAEKFGLGNELQFAGELPHHEVLNLMKRSKILLHPSSYEGFSGVCVESLACGAHVVSFCRAMEYQIDHWHIVNSKEEMKHLLVKLLQQELEHKPVVVSDMKQTAMQIMDLFS
jgi:glycosyltransferase involved in cell wall biosynthesis